MLSVKDSTLKLGLRGVYISYQVDTTELLHKLAANTEQSSVQESLGTILHDCSLATSTLRSSSLFINCVLNLCHLLLYLRVCGFDGFGVKFESPEDVSRFLVFVVCKKPSRTFWEDNNTRECDDSEYNLQSKWYSELRSTIDKTEAVVNPVCHHDTT